MVATVGSIQVLFDANFKSAVNGINSFAGATERSGKKTQKSLRRTDKSVLSLNRSMASLNGRNFRVLSLSALRASNSVDRLRGLLLATSTLAGGLGAAFTIKGIADYSDQYKEIGNRLRIVKKEGQGQAEIQEKIFRLAQRSRSEYAGTAVLFSRMSVSAKKLNISQKDIVKTVETVQKAFLVGGSTPIESTQSARQLSQGIASDRLGGDELRGVLENQALGQLLANSITEGDIGKLRELSEAGELTAGVVLRAFSDASDEINNLFADTEQTITQAFVKIDNALLNYIGTSEKVTDGSRATVVFLNAIAENMDTVGDSVVLLGGAMALLIGAKGFGGLANASGRSLIAMKANRIELRASALEAITLAKAEKRITQTKLLSSRLALNQAYRTGNFTTKQVTGLEKKAAQATENHARSLKNVKLATDLQTASTKRLGIAGTVSAVSMRGLSTSMAFLGGPVGVALIALGAAMYVVSKNAAEAEERSDRYSDAIEKAGDKSKGTAGSIREVAAEMSKLSKIRDFIDFDEKFKEATQDIKSFKNELSGLASETYAGGFNVMNAELQKLINGFVSGQVSSDEFNSSLNDFARNGFISGEKAKRIQELADSIESAKGSLDGLNEKIDDFDGKTAEATVKVSFVNDLSGVDKAKLVSKLKKNAEEFVEANEDAIKDKFKEGKLDLITTRIYADLLTGVKKNKPKKGTKSDAVKLAEKFEKTLDRLAYKAETFSFSNIDKQAVETARSIGIADDKIRQFIASVEGDGVAPAQLVSIRDSLQKIADLKFAHEFDKLKETNVVQFLSELDRETIRTARSFGVAEEQVKNFITAASTGNFDVIPPKIAAIRGELESLANNKDLVDFMDGYADILGNTLNSMFDSLFDSGKSIDEIMKDAGKSIAKLIFQLLVVEPLIKSIRASMGGGGSSPTNIIASALTGAITGGVGSAAPSGPVLLPGIYHKGGDVGSPKSTRAVSAGVFNGAPRFHKGLGSREFAAILEEGERVSTAKQTGAEANVISNLSKMAGSSRNRSSSNVYNIDARGAQQGVGAEIKQALMDYDKTLPNKIQGKIAKVQNSPRKRTGTW